MKINFAQVTTAIKTVGTLYNTHKRGIKKCVKWICGGGAVIYGVTKAAKTMRDIEEAGEKKGEALTTMEKAGIIIKDQAPAIALATAAVAADISLDIDSAKKIKTVTEENKSLIGQIADIGNTYNTVNAVKNALEKKLSETQGEKIVEEVKEAAVREPNIERYNEIPVTQRSYVADRSQLEEWNDIYLRTGDVDYKVQEYLIACVGQSVLSCNHEMSRAERFLIKRQSQDKGFITLDDVLEAVHAKTVGGAIGENFVWRYGYETFGFKAKEMNNEGVAMFSLGFIKEPYYDREGMYYD